MGKNRTNSEKYNKNRFQGGQTFSKNSYNDPRNKNFKFKNLNINKYQRYDFFERNKRRTYVNESCL